MTPPGSLGAHIAAIRAQLRPSEAKLADLALARPREVIEMTMDEIAARVGVSPPTVARFCAAVGCRGFREFKIRLAQDRAAGLPFVHPDVDEDDTPAEIATKVIDRALTALIDLRRRAGTAGLDLAVDILTAAARIEFYGSGNSGIVAKDLQHKFFRLGIPTAAYSDPHVFCMSALTLQPGDAVVLISNSGRSRDLLEAAHDAASVGADIIAITRTATPLAALATAVIAADVVEDADIYSPMTSRIAHLVLGDVLSVAVAQRKGVAVRDRLERAKTAVRRRRLIPPEV